MEKEVLGQDYDTVISSYYGDDVVTAIITVKVDTKEADKLAAEMTDFDCIEDVFLVTGDTDIVAKARFNNYRDLKEFVVGNLGKLGGVKETKTLMVVTTYKERGVKKDI